MLALIASSDITNLQNLSNSGGSRQEGGNDQVYQYNESNY